MTAVKQTVFNEYKSYNKIPIDTTCIIVTKENQTIITKILENNQDGKLIITETINIPYTDIKLLKILN